MHYLSAIKAHVVNVVWYRFYPVFWLMFLQSQSETLDLENCVWPLSKTKTKHCEHSTCRARTKCPVYCCSICAVRTVYVVTNLFTQASALMDLGKWQNVLDVTLALSLLNLLSTTTFTVSFSKYILYPTVEYLNIKQKTAFKWELDVIKITWPSIHSVFYVSLAVLIGFQSTKRYGQRNRANQRRLEK